MNYRVGDAFMIKNLKFYDYVDKVIPSIFYKEFFWHKKIKDFGMELSKEQIDSMCQSLYYYTSIWHVPLRKYIYTGVSDLKINYEGLIMDIDKSIELFGKGIEFYKLDKSVQTKRKVSFPLVNKDKLIELWLKDGFILDKSFMSTSLSDSYRHEKKPFEFTLDLDINVDIKNGIYLRGLSRVPNEDEFLVRRNSKLYFDPKDLILEKEKVKVKGHIQ